MFSLARILRMVAIFVLSAPVISSIAYSATVNDNFDLGTKAFINKYYPQALQYFQAAKDNGLKTISLTYNIAVTHYKLENYKQSQIYFNQIRSNPKMQHLVDYNLGLIALKLKNTKQAISLFSDVYNTTQNKKLRMLAKKQLKNLNISISTTPRKIKTRVTLTKGFTDNVTSIATGAASGQSDDFSIIAASIEGALSNTLNRGITAKLRFFYQDLTQFNQFDFRDTELNLKYKFLYAGYLNYVSTFVKKSSLNNLSYQSKLGLEAKAKNRIDNNHAIYYRYRYESIQEDSARYSYLSGSKHQIRVNYQLKLKNSVNQFRYQYEINNRNDTLTRSYSPQRHSFRYSYSFRFLHDWKSKTYIEYRKSIYPNVATQNRDDDRIRFYTALAYKLTKKWNIQGRYEYRDNQSTDSTYVYTRNVYYFDLNFKY
ncbi:hypothetical protein MNBD_GAMMA22-374 [hydrothermal vent metagenome]|uniref:Uncharacterized protein n=1 Tax=hydrothermal vent metagenome TaxID=652676 RepID=A0A3B1AV73_9ZZZZ